MSIALQAQGLTKSYQNFKALDALDLEIPEGAIYGLLGPNGAGKTTFLRMVNQIIEPDSGSLHLHGETMTPAHARQIGYLPEERGLYKKMKVGEQALYLAQLKGMGAAEAKAKLKEWFIRWELQSWWDKKVEELSKGQAQKIQFITTVLHQPKVLIFDEPFSGFDPVNAALIRDEMLRLHQEGSTIILSTHRMESVEELCSHIALINKGVKVLDGKVQDIREANRSNQYKLVFRGEAPASWELPEGITAGAQQHDARSGHPSITFQAASDRSSELMSALARQCHPISFEEVLPSMNDIFIQNVHA
jgi:ABC-2 type transport system ATP-binding protein